MPFSVHVAHRVRSVCRLAPEHALCFVPPGAVWVGAPRRHLTRVPVSVAGAPAGTHVVGTTGHPLRCTGTWSRSTRRSASAPKSPRCGVAPQGGRPHPAGGPGGGVGVARCDRSIKSRATDMTRSVTRTGVHATFTRRAPPRARCACARRRPLSGRVRDLDAAVPRVRHGRRHPLLGHPHTAARHGLRL